MPALVECVPNFSEGRDPGTLGALRAALTSVPGVRLLDVQADASHHRSVFTFVAAPDAAVEAAFRAIRTARERINLTRHKGAHPRMGSTDVVPFIPLEGATMDDCVQLARRLGERVGKELQIPVYLYARAATRPERERLPDIRKGEFEGLREAIGRDPAREPDFGPHRIHATAGATAIGARPFLVAYNVYLKGCDVTLAKSIAKSIRTSDGGLSAVQARGFDVEGEPQVSINLLDLDATSLHAAFGAVDAAARRAGAQAVRSEIVGLVPERAAYEAAGAHLRLQDALEGHVLERQVRRTAGPGLGEWMDSVASASPSPGGGTVSAIAGGVAAALAAMVGRLTVGRKKYAEVDAEFRELVERAEELRLTLVRLGDEDAAAYGAVSAAYGIPKTEEERRTAAIQAALLNATYVPLETLRAARDVAALAARAALAGNTNAVSDAGVAALLADAAARGAAYNVRINVAGLPDPTVGEPLIAEAKQLVAETGRDAARAAAAVEAAIDA